MAGALALSLLVLLQVGCGSDPLAPLDVSPAAGSGGSGGSAGTAGTSGEAGTSGQAGSGDLGAPCGEDAECDDQVDCTEDRCDPDAGRCRNLPIDQRCQNGIHCDGIERCDSKLGCRAGLPVTCNDDNACTIDICLEGSDDTGPSCRHDLRDIDGDGDPDMYCGGGDCNDNNPAISSKLPEICGNGLDDNCNGVVDEANCISPSYDTCSNPFAMHGAGLYPIDGAGAKLDTSASCAPTLDPLARDIIGLLFVPDGPAQQLDLSMTFASGNGAIAVAGTCGDGATELACGKATWSTKGGLIARTRIHSLSPGNYAVMAYLTQGIPAQIRASLSPASSPPTNETCGTAAPLTPGQSIIAPLVGTHYDLPSRCGGGSDLVYRLDLGAPADIRAFASSVDGIGYATVSLWQNECASGDEIGCAYGSAAQTFARSVGPGAVYVAVSTSTGGDASLLVTLEPPTEPPADESCTSEPPLLASGTDLILDLTDHTDDVSLCGAAGMIDAVHTIATSKSSDVLVVLRTSSGTIGAVALAESPCDLPQSLLACGATGSSPFRASAMGLSPGEYRVISELSNATPAKLSAFVRDATTPVFVPFADTCPEALQIPPEGGFFQGSTTNASANTPAGCDQAGTGAYGAPEQFLRLELSAKKRVLLDSNGSNYATLLDVRKGPQCPGTEVANACTVSYGSSRAFLDLTLDAGTYFIQVDGFNGASGNWQLNVFVVDP